MNNSLFHSLLSTSITPIYLTDRLFYAPILKKRSNILSKQSKEKSRHGLQIDSKMSS